MRATLFPLGALLLFPATQAAHGFQACTPGWVPPFGGAPGTNSLPLCMEVFDDGSGAGPSLFVGGQFVLAGGITANRIAAYNGQGWRALGSGMDEVVEALAVHDDGLGGGPALYAGGAFHFAGGVNATRVAKWDGQSWSSFGAPIAGSVDALRSFGGALILGGAVQLVAGQPATGIARWDGQSWAPLGGGIVGSVFDLCSFDDGGGTALYAAGNFAQAGGQPIAHIARWDGATWSSVGGGIGASVNALTVFDDGTGPALYAGGSFSTAGGQSAPRVARWDGQSWSAVGDMMGSVQALVGLDASSGIGPMLVAGGLLSTPFGQELQGVVRWDGQSWAPLGSGVGGAVPAALSFGVFDDGMGGGAGLYIGGTFDTSPGGASYLGKWGCPGDPFESMLGCFDNQATLLASTAELHLGSPFDLTLFPGQFSSGVGLLFVGADGTGADTCGVFVPDLGEILLAAVPGLVPLGTQGLVGGVATFPLAVPNSPSFVGVRVAFQGAAVDVTDPAFPSALTNGLRAGILP